MVGDPLQSGVRIDPSVGPRRDEVYLEIREVKRARRSPECKTGWLCIAISLSALFAALPLYASEQCRRCHQEEVETYLRTGMGRSLSRPDSNQPSGMYSHGHSGTTFSIELSDRGMVHGIKRNGNRATYSIDYVIGSGNAAFGYLVQVEDAIFQSPITYYSEHKRWGMAPGMERYSDPDFTRPASAECLWCHAGRPRPVPGSVNRYRSPPFESESISCDRCHGPSDRHLQSPAAATIFNPAKAAPRERDSVCEQCHLTGLTRVLNPGQTFGSFQPGHRLEEFWSVFVGATDNAEAQSRFQVVSHVEQLALSRCAQLSGQQLWCGTCHDPHASSSNSAAAISKQCMACHAEGLDAAHADQPNHCTACHMSKRQSHDSGHSAFTDHRIMRRPIPARPAPGPRKIKPWKPQDGAIGLRNLGIALIRLGESNSPAGDIRKGVTLLRSALSALNRDPSALEALGTGLVLSGSPTKGLGMLREAVREDPDRSLFRNSLAAAWWNLGARRATIREIEHAIRLEPHLESGYHMLSRVNQALGNPAKARSAWSRLLARRPRLLFAREQLALLPAKRGWRRGRED